MNEKRGLVLSALIIIFGFAILVASLFLLVDNRLRSFLGNLPDWFNLYVVLLLIGRLIALYGIWNFMRWGVYILLLSECVEISLGIFVFTGVLILPNRAIIGIPLFLVVILIWFLVLRPKWDLFI